jgi:hypothetical protein
VVFNNSNQSLFGILFVNTSREISYDLKYFAQNIGFCFLLRYATSLCDGSHSGLFYRMYELCYFANKIFNFFLLNVKCIIEIFWMLWNLLNNVKIKKFVWFTKKTIVEKHCLLYYNCFHNTLGKLITLF